MSEDSPQLLLDLWQINSQLLRERKQTNSPVCSITVHCSKGGRQLSEHFSRTRKMYKQTRVIYLNLLINYTERKQTRNRKPSCTEALWREQLIGLIRPKAYSVNINNEQTKLPALRFSVSLQAINNNFAVQVGTRSNTAQNQL